MSKRTVLAAISLISVGIIFGAIVVSSFSGISLSLAGPNVEFNTTPPFTPSADVLSLNETFTKVSSTVTPSVVFITVTARTSANRTPFHDFFNIPDGPRETQGSGSGIILTQDGYILTNKHVVEGAKDDGIRVTLNDSREFNATLVGQDENTDIAVIKIDVSDLKPASMGNSDDVKVGEWVIAVGNPLGLTSTVTAGIVSAISRNIGIIRSGDGLGIENFIQTDAAINPGNSGGALVNLYGQVIGVNTAIASNTGRSIGYGFAVPINLAQTVANVIIKEGKFVRGYIGIRISDMDAKKAKALGLDRFRGVLVENLVEDGAGEAAGVRDGDVIVEVDGKEVMSASQLQARVGMHQPGDIVKLKIWRDGKYIDKQVKLKGKDGEAEKLSSADDGKKSDASDARTTLTFEKAGFTVQGLDSDARKKFDRTTGVLVTDVKQFSPAFENNLRPNVVIFEARKGGTVLKIESVGDLKKIINALGPGESVLLRVQTDNGDTAFIPIEGPAS